MILEFFLYISVLLSSIFIISRYVMPRYEPLTKESPILDKLLYGVAYGMIGIGIMYVHHVFNKSYYTDPRQIAVLLAFFYGGWIPALISSFIIFTVRASIFNIGANLPLLTFSMLCTMAICHVIMQTKVRRSIQFYLSIFFTMLEIYILLCLRDQLPLFDPHLLHFAFLHVIGAVFSYHFNESLRKTYFIVEELKESKKELQEAESNYRYIAEHSSDLIVVLDVNAVSLYISPSYQSIFGIKPEHYVGTIAGQFVHPDDSFFLRQTWEHVVKEKTSTYGVYRYPHADGHWIWLESLFVPVLNEDHEIEKVILTSRDITERKQTEEIIRNTEKLSIVGELAAGIAHEIRNPLTTLKGFTQMIKKDPSLAESYFLDVMYEELNRIELITNELLYLAKPQVHELKEISIEGMLRQLKTLLQPQAMLQSITLTTDVKENLPVIKGMEDRLKQVFINLIKNGMEAMPKGGEITIQAIREDESTLLLSIKDEGVGISEDRIEKLGQPFYSLKEKGTGLGLTVCKKIIQEHNGKMKFHSTVGVGTVVEVRLPLKIGAE